MTTSLDDQVNDVANCPQRGELCVAEVVPGFDVALLAQRLASCGVTWAWCHSTASRDLWGEVAQADLVDRVVADLVDRVVASIVAVPFAPAQRSRRRRLQSDSIRLLRRAARDVHWALDSVSVPPAKLAAGIRRSQAWALQVVPAPVVKRYWELAAIFDGDIITQWISDLARYPNPLLDQIRAKGIRSVVIPDGDLLGPDEPAAVALTSLANAIAAQGVQVVVVTDPASKIQGLAPSCAGHRHPLEVSSTTSTGVLCVLGETDAFGQHRVLESVTSEDGHSSAHRFATRGQLIVSLAAMFVRSEGVTCRSGARQSLATTGHCELGLADLRGQSVLLVTPKRSESVALARQLGNYLDPEPEILTEGDLWRSGAELVMRLLDPCGRSSGDDPTSDAAARHTVRKLGETWWQRHHGSRPLPQGCADALKAPATAAPGASIGADDEAAYHDVVGEVCKQLRGVALSSGAAEESDWARELVGHLEAHLRLLGSGNVAKLANLGHQIGDLRAHGFLQSASGSQRWLPRAAAARRSDGDRLTVAEDIDRQLRRRRPTTRIGTAQDTATLYVTHIQRTGMDRADHIIICRTLQHHMPFTRGSSSGQPPDPRREEALFYRALRGAGLSVHLLSVGDTPYFYPFSLFKGIVDH